jgi:hypothetical protein
LPPPELQIAKTPVQSVQTGSPPGKPSHRQSPHAIPFNDDELDASTSSGTDDLPLPQRYNLRSQARHIIQSAIDDGEGIPDDHFAFAVIDEETGKALDTKI